MANFKLVGSGEEKRIAELLLGKLKTRYLLEPQMERLKLLRSNGNTKEREGKSKNHIYR